MMKKLLIAAMLAGSLGSVAVTSSAAVVIVRDAPPAERAERAPQPRRGYLWVPGHWDWKYDNHVWTRGHWLKARAGYVYQAPAWEQRDGRWHMSHGAWVRAGRDQDGDGVRNRNDRDRDGDGIRNRNDRDRDGDGVRNRNDRNPNNPNRN